MDGLDLVALPKVQLHCHLEGTVRAETFRALAAKYGVELGERADPAERMRSRPSASSCSVCQGERDTAPARRLRDDRARLRRGRGRARRRLRGGLHLTSVWTFFHHKARHPGDRRGDPPPPSTRRVGHLASTSR